MSDSYMASDPPTVRECLTLLQRGTIGRVGFVAQAQPRVFPVNYVAADDGRVVFRTGEHSLLSSIDGNRVAFEIDGYDTKARSGWCVHVAGTAREITDAADAAAVRLRTLRVEPWAKEPKERWFEISPLEISGRRIQANDWPDPLQGWFAGVPAS